MRRNVQMALFLTGEAPYIRRSTMKRALDTASAPLYSRYEVVGLYVTGLRFQRVELFPRAKFTTNRGRFLWCYHIAAPGQSSYPVPAPNLLYSGTLPSAALRSIHGILYNKQLREFCQQINPR